MAGYVRRGSSGGASGGASDPGLARGVRGDDWNCTARTAPERDADCSSCLLTPTATPVRRPALSP
jgi:hypothetical protein